MDKFVGTAEEARSITKKVGAAYFRNLIFKRIRESAESGERGVTHCCADQMDAAIVEDVTRELEEKGYEISVDDNDNEYVMYIGW